MEVYDSCNADGLYCSLVTGQERREVPGAGHTACTVEMVRCALRCAALRCAALRCTVLRCLLARLAGREALQSDTPGEQWRSRRRPTPPWPQC